VAVHLRTLPAQCSGIHSAVANTLFCSIGDNSANRTVTIKRMIR
jgi:hypothetical protein